jgi:hypothetical protein
MAQNYKIASEWETATDADKTNLKAFIKGVVGYSCKIACKISEEKTVDIYVFSEKKQKVTDWIEIQESGAIGVIYDFYDEEVLIDKLEKACDSYNNSNNLVFEFGSDSSNNGEDEEVDEDSDNNDTQK